MSQINSLDLQEALERRMTNRHYLRKIGIQRGNMEAFLRDIDIAGHAARIARQPKITWESVIEEMKDGIRLLCPTPPAGWRRYCYDWVLQYLFPRAEAIPADPRYDQGVYFIYEMMRTILMVSRDGRPDDPVFDFELPGEEEIRGSGAYEEYLTYRRVDRNHYLYEFMHLGAELTGYNTLGHVAGVHNVAMFAGRQLAQRDVPVDLALVSASAALHDIGKYGCRKKEQSRVPYLHYYYTDECLNHLGMPMTAHIASNHSTWDLELENLSVENLLLIYADFRVKSTHAEDGTEIIHINTLDDAFDIILQKLDNVDDRKKARYQRVYAKLHDFEDYMKSLGISTDLDDYMGRHVTKKDAVLLNPEESVQRFKYMAIEHNILVMHHFGNDADLASLLEDARSEKQWKNIRAYLNTLEEYFTYMTGSQKRMTMNFARELLIHHEGDIRRLAASLIGQILASYDKESRKELPEDVVEDPQTGSSRLWSEHIDYVINADSKLTERQRRWRGYTLKITMSELIENASGREKKRLYMKQFVDVLRGRIENEDTLFVVLDTMLEVPFGVCSKEDIELMAAFCSKAVMRDVLEIQVAALRAVQCIATTAGYAKLSARAVELMEQTLETDVEGDEEASVVYLKATTASALDFWGERSARCRNAFYDLSKATSRIFRENLQVGTPWNIKVVNIELMLEELEHGKRTSAFYIATHLANLLKVSERVTVRHRAGEGLIRLFDMLDMDQRSEIVIELTKGLEIGEYQFSKYIPDYLGIMIAKLPLESFNETLYELEHLLESSNDRVAGVTLDTLAVLLNYYMEYNYDVQAQKRFKRHRIRIIGMLLRGLANYHESVSQEAFMVIGEKIFGSGHLSLQEKLDIFQIMGKKMLTLIQPDENAELRFYNNAAALNHIYRFISDYQFYLEETTLEEKKRVAFFPGTFDPFSLGHKGIVRTIVSMGFQVYLALDEFSWSKNTQPRKYRKKIVEMSCASETEVFLLPDDVPINIANGEDLQILKEIFSGKDLYIVVGSDVVANASSYRKPAGEHSIHSINHIIFRRVSAEQGERSEDHYMQNKKQIRGHIVELALPVQLEDISSTRIRENIDNNRDIASLIDPVVQNYIYDNSLYMRSSQYKAVLEENDLSYRVSRWEGPGETISIVDESRDGKILAEANVRKLDLGHLYEEFEDFETMKYIRGYAVGMICIIKSIYVDPDWDEPDASQMILSETLAEALKQDFTYAVYHPDDRREAGPFLDVLARQGFAQIINKGTPTDCYAVDMRNPVVLLQNMDTKLKEPFRSDPVMQKTLNRARIRMQESLNKMFPGTLILAINSTVMQQKLIKKVTVENNVPAKPRKKRRLGPYICVPYGKILTGTVVPNTVTKVLHTQKCFTKDLHESYVKEYPFYASIEDQVRTIHSFNRKAILVDDILHKGYQIQRLLPTLKEGGVDVERVIVGIMSGSGKDMMKLHGMDVDSVYFVPNLKCWFVESEMYPFIDGDGVEHDEGKEDMDFTSINMIMPYVAPHFLEHVSRESLYDFSMTCLENTKEILQTLEAEYQKAFGRKMTLQRLSEAVSWPVITDVGSSLDYDYTIAASCYIEDDMERLKRIKDYLR